MLKLKTDHKWVWNQYTTIISEIKLNDAHCKEKIKWKLSKREGKAQRLEDEDFKCLIRFMEEVKREFGGGGIKKIIPCVYSRINKYKSGSPKNSKQL